MRTTHLSRAVLAICLALAVFVAPVPASAESQIGNGTQIPDSDLQNHAEVAYIRIGSSYCSGSFIAPRVVITAAHCLDDGAFETVAWVQTARQANGSGGNIFTVQPFGHFSEHFSGQDQEHPFYSDIAMFGVNEPNPSFYDLSPASDVPASGVLELFGYGENNDPTTPDHGVLYTYEDPVVDCQHLTLGPDDLCSGGDGLDQSCGGDSGMPALLNGELIGVHKGKFNGGGAACGEVGDEYVAIYTAVPNMRPTFEDWIADPVLEIEITSVIETEVVAQSGCTRHFEVNFEAVVSRTRANPDLGLTIVGTGSQSAPTSLATSPAAGTNNHLMTGTAYRVTGSCSGSPYNFTVQARLDKPGWDSIYASAARVQDPCAQVVASLRIVATPNSDCLTGVIAITSSPRAKVGDVPTVTQAAPLSHNTARN